MPCFQLKYSQTIPGNLNQVWEFFSNPTNLSRITPAWLNFTVVDKDLPKIYAGMFIKYYVSPILGIKQLWVTEITAVRELEYFVDEQRIGPYKIWHHQHFFKEHKDGVEIIDIVDYQIGYGPLDWIIDRLIIRNKIRQIFSFRQKVISELFQG